VWVEIPTFDGFALLIGNHYFPPDIKPEIIGNYFRFSENKLNTYNFIVIMVGDFITPGFDLKRDLSLPKPHYYSKLKGGKIYTSTRLLILSDLCFIPVDPGLVKPHNYHPLWL
jgi:hypothetical protein